MLKISEKVPKVTALPEGVNVINSCLENVRAKMVEDICYYEDLKIRMLIPEQVDNNNTHPLVIHIQGSAWMKQDLNDHLIDFVKIVEEGYILAVVEYRPTPNNIFPSQIHDTKRAIRYLYNNSQKYNIDINNIFVSGDSSGGHCALLYWLTCNNSKLDYCSEELPPIKGVIDLYGVTNILTMSDYPSVFNHEDANSPEGLLVGGKVKDRVQIAKEASPVNYIDDMQDNGPLLMIHGNCDSVVPVYQSIEFYNKCLEFDKDVTFYVVDDADHGGSTFFINKTINVILRFLKSNTN